MAKAPQPPKAPTRDLLALFDRLHQEALGVRAVIRPGKDAALVASLWRSHSDLVEPLMHDFFASDDPFVQDNGYSVGMFFGQFAKLIMRKRRQMQDQLQEAWQSECKRTHGGTCTKALHHYTRMREMA